MKDTALYFLHKVAREIQDNKFAAFLYNKINAGGNNITKEELDGWNFLSEFYAKDTSSIELIDYDNTKIERGNKDYRFLNISLKAFRKFPPQKKFGISFCDGNQEPSSVLIQGGNGTGKTSVFSAMEMLFTGNVSAANKQGYNTKTEIEDYVHYARSDDKEYIEVKTKPETIKYGEENPLQTLCLMPFFCTEYDIDKLIGNKKKNKETEENPLNIFVYEQMGFGLVKKIIDKIDKEIEDFKKIEERISYTSESDKEKQVATLDSKISIHSKLKKTFLRLFLELEKEKGEGKNVKENKLEELKNSLLTDIKEEEISDKKFEEEENLIKVFFEGDDKNYFVSLYSKTKEAAEAGSKDDNIFTKQNPNNLKKILDELNDARKHFQEIIYEVSNEGQLPEFEDFVKQYDNIEQRYRKEQNEAEEKEKVRKEIDYYEQNKTLFEVFLKALKDKVYGTIDTTIRKSIDMVKEILNIFLMPEEGIDFNFDKESGKFKMDVILKKDDETSSDNFTPEYYFNTFRYKLYCMTVKMAIAFAMKKFYQINFPIVMDDIFYSSDFANKIMVRDYFRILFDKHKELFPGDEMELQLIFFSHDEVLIDAAYRGINKVANVNRQILFDYREIEEDKKEEKSKTQNETENEPQYFINLTRVF